MHEHHHHKMNQEPTDDEKLRNLPQELFWSGGDYKNVIHRLEVKYLPPGTKRQKTIEYNKLKSATQGMKERGFCTWPDQCGIEELLWIQKQKTDMMAAAKVMKAAWDDQMETFQKQGV